jgi:hypothetical protein
MKAKPNWENVDPGRDDTPDRLHIGQEEWPEGMAMQWITASVRGQEFPGRRMLFDQGGWTPVHQEDFDGKFNGRFMLRDAPGEITVEGLVLVARPIEFTERARVAEKRRAREQLEIKERAFRSGEIPNVSFDTKHESALRTNKISKSYERIDVPKDS